MFFSRDFTCTSNTDRLPSYSAGAIIQLAEGQNDIYVKDTKLI